jgi:RND family efflux transporter MFP subunit
MPMAAKKASLEDLRIEDSARQRGRGPLVLWLALVVGAVVLGIVAWLRLAAPGAAATVQVATVTERLVGSGAGAADTVLNASGYVTARRRATVSSKVTGKVRAVYVEEGMAVREGQVLAELDDTTARRYLAVAEAQLSAAKRNLDETDVRLKEAQVNLARSKSLVAEGISTQADLDTAKASFDALGAHLTAAREQVLVAEAQLAVSRNDLNDTTIRAPFTGVAISKDAQPGEMISPVSAGGGFTRTGICTIVDMKSLEVEVDVNESYIGRVTPGQKVDATLDAYPDWQIPTHVITLVPTADRQKATVLVRIAFEQLDARILPDMGVKVAFHSQPLAAGSPAGAPKKRLVAPRRAVRSEGGQDVVFIVRDLAAVRRAVQLGASEGDDVEIVSGLSAGDRVIVDGPKDLADGRKVVVR